MQAEGKVPDDRHTAIYVASLRGGVSAGPGRDGTKTGMMWVASRWQLGDCLTKAGLSEVFREVIKSATTKFHEMSMQQLRRDNTSMKRGSAEATSGE